MINDLGKNCGALKDIVCNRNSVTMACLYCGTILVSYMIGYRFDLIGLKCGQDEIVEILQHTYIFIAPLLFEICISLAIIAKQLGIL